MGLDCHGNFEPTPEGVCSPPISHREPTYLPTYLSIPPPPHQKKHNPKKQVPKDGETVAGNPNTLYGFVGFNDSNYRLVPPDYPPFDWPPDQPSGPCVRACVAGTTLLLRGASFDSLIGWQLVDSLIVFDVLDPVGPIYLRWIKNLI